MTCYHWCGGYAVPAPTATGSIQRDMCLIDSCLGVGEVAVSDHRSSVPSVNHLANIARYKKPCMMDCTQPAYLHKANQSPYAPALCIALLTISASIVPYWYGLQCMQGVGLHRIVPGQENCCCCAQPTCPAYMTMSVFALGRQ